MYLSLNWLKEFVRFKQTPEKVADVFTLGGFEVEKLIPFGEDMDKVVVGQIKSIVSHPGADKLTVCKVDVGRSKPQTIVCGAKNIKAGDKVPVALVGADLPNGMKIEARRIRGADSEGMLCAEDELGLGEDHSGIIILDSKMRVGAKFTDAIKLKDTALDLAISPNRADGFSVLGLAREFAALTKQKLIEPKITVKESSKYSIKKMLSVSVRDYKLCPKYTARIVRNVKVKPSPEWLQSRLRIMGVKPINTIVDITNYVMLELGQPLHAFDYSTVSGKKIIVRKAGKDRTFTTLDGEKRDLNPSMLMIADAKGPVAIAGVMGGANSEITKKTKDVVIESAIFQPLSIRKARQALGLVTEASTRFEKGIWPDLPEQAVDRAAQLMQELAGGEVARGRIVAAPKTQDKPRTVKVSLDYISGLIGRTFTRKDAVSYLERLHFTVTGSDDTLSVQVPTWRQDISRPADIAEEVGRMYGWNQLKKNPITTSLRIVPDKPLLQTERDIRQALSSRSMQEVLNYSFYSDKHASVSGLPASKHYTVSNPLNPDQQYLRSSLIPRLFDIVVSHYQERSEMALFEMGTVFFKGAKGPVEERMLAGIWYRKGKVRDEHQLLRALKDRVQTLAEDLDIRAPLEYRPQKNHQPYLEISANGTALGRVGWLTRETKLGQPPVYFEMSVGALDSLRDRKRPYKPVSEYPFIYRDLTLTAVEGVSYPELREDIYGVDPLITSVEAVDLYEARDSMTLRLRFQSRDRTLSSDEVDDIVSRVLGEIKKSFNITLKS